MELIKKLNQSKLPRLEKKPNPRKSKLILFILLLAFFTRTYKLKTPLADWHSWRQVDTASVARQYLDNGINLLIPKYLDLSDIPSGKDNPEGYRMVEFPLVSGIVAFLYKNISTNLELHVFYRLINILFSLGSTYLIFKIVDLLESRRLAHLSAFIFAILPYNIFYSRSVLPEVSLVFFTLLELYFVAKYFKSKDQSLSNPYFWTAALSGAVAMLIKPYALVLMLPMMYLGFKTNGIKLIKDKKVYLYLAIILLPYILWRRWILKFPEGIPAYLWLLNGNDIRFKGAFFRWIFADRLSRLILGYWGLLFLGLGFIKKFKSAFFSWWLIAILIYIFTFATGNVQHDYYQIITIPIISIYSAKGIVFLLNQKSLKSKLLILVAFGFMLAFSWYEVRGYFNINNPAIVEAGKFVDQNTQKDALVIAPYQGDTAFLYQTNRRGWPIGGSIESRISQGANYYVTTALDDEAKNLMAKCEVIETNDRFTLIKLECHKDRELIQTDEFQQFLNDLDSSGPQPTPKTTPTPTPSPTPDIDISDLPPGLQKKYR